MIHHINIIDPTKAIPIPISGPVDVAGMESIIRHPYFELLRHRRQLGWTMMDWPGGRHSRMEHCLGTLARIRRILARFQIPPSDPIYTAMEVYALGHDIGHGPTCHELEYVLGHNHNQIGIERLREMSDVITTYSDPATVLDLFGNKDNPWRRLVKDKTIGADKMDYLERDAHHIGYQIALNLDRVINCLQYVDGIFGVDELAKDIIMTNQQSFMWMYIYVYLHPRVKLFARMYQRALTEALRQNDVDYRAVWDMTDSQVEAMISDHPLMERILKRELMQTAVACKISGHESEEVLEPDGQYPIIGIDRALIQSWSRTINKPSEVHKLEKFIEKEFNLGEHSVLVVQTDLYQRLQPSDVKIYSHRSRKFLSLFELNPEHRQKLLTLVDRSFSIRIVTRPRLRNRLQKCDLASLLKTFFAQQ